jgi:hypothetical protein
MGNFAKYPMVLHEKFTIVQKFKTSIAQSKIK